jgi:antitoxin (DNA-binding transcriptional repressor) of toxin-antitoxin stability system
MGRLYRRPTLPQRFHRLIERVFGEPLAVSRHGQVVFEVRLKRVPAIVEGSYDSDAPRYEITGGGRVLYRIVAATARSDARAIPAVELPADWVSSDALIGWGLGKPLALTQHGKVISRLRVKRVPAVDGDRYEPDEPYESTWRATLVCRIVAATADSPARVITFANVPAGW